MKNRLALTGSLCAMTALIFSTETVMQSARFALDVCYRSILPSLFPFFILSILLAKLGLPARLGRYLAAPAARLFGVSGVGATALIIGLTGGYPLGASYIGDMVAQKIISRDEAERLLFFCNNSGPAFLIGAVGGGVFHSTRIGMLLYLTHALSAVAGGVLLRKRKMTAHNLVNIINDIPFSVVFSSAVKQAVSSALSVCGFVVCFTVLVGLLDSHGLVSLLAGRFSDLVGLELHASRAALVGILEIGSAVGAMQGISPTPIQLAVTAAILGWGGLSVHCQTAAVLSESDLSLKMHSLGRLNSAVVSAALVYAFSAFLKL